MRKKLCLLVMMMSALTLSAQMYVIPEAGMAAYRKDGDFNKSWNAGWKAGVAVEYRFKPGIFSLQSGAYYMNRSSYSQTTLIDVDHGYLSVMGGNVTNHYLQVPLLAKFNVKLNSSTGISAAFGPYVGIPLRYSYESSSLSVKYNDLISGYYWIAPYEYSGGYQRDGYHGGYGGSSINAIGENRPVIQSNRQKSKGKPYGLDGGMMFRLDLDVNNFVIGLAYDLNFADGNTWDGRQTYVDYHTFNVSLGYKFRIF